MGLFSARQADLDDRSREYIVTGSPLVARDEILVLADVVAAFTPRPPRPDVPEGLQMTSWSGDGEPAIRAVVITAMRIWADDGDAADLLSDRTGLVAGIDRALAFAPVAVGFEGHTIRAEISPYAAGVESSDRFDVLGR